MDFISANDDGSSISEIIFIYLTSDWSESVMLTTLPVSLFSSTIQPAWRDRLFKTYRKSIESDCDLPRNHTTCFPINVLLSCILAVVIFLEIIQLTNVILSHFTFHKEDLNSKRRKRNRRFSHFFHFSPFSPFSAGGQEEGIFEKRTKKSLNRFKILKMYVGSNTPSHFFPLFRCVHEYLYIRGCARQPVRPSIRRSVLVTSCLQSDEFL